VTDSELTFIIEGEDTDDGYSVDALDLTSGEKVADKLAGLNFPDGRTVWGFLSTFSVRTGMTEEKVEVLSFQQLPESGLPLVKPLS
jgi:hypothetical protein